MLIRILAEGYDMIMFMFAFDAKLSVLLFVSDRILFRFIPWGDTKLKLSELVNRIIKYNSADGRLGQCWISHKIQMTTRSWTAFSFFKLSLCFIFFRNNGSIRVSSWCHSSAILPTHSPTRSIHTHTHTHTHTFLAPSFAFPVNRFSLKLCIPAQGAELISGYHCNISFIWTSYCAPRGLPFRTRSARESFNSFSSLGPTMCTQKFKNIWDRVTSSGSPSWVHTERYTALHGRSPYLT